MPSGPRIDAPGAFHHVRARGIDRTVIFRSAHDRDDFLRRLSTVVERRWFDVYAWALMPTHVHLLVRTGRRPLGRTMQALLTGFARAFNLRHGRVGHLFQDRYKSTLCDTETYFLELVRYVHLNPIRAGLVGGLEELARFPYTGDSVLMGSVTHPWQATGRVLERFGATIPAARDAYRRFLELGLDDLSTEPRPFLAEEDVATAHVQSSRDPAAGGERRIVEDAIGGEILATVRLDDLLRRISEREGIAPAAILGESRVRVVARARDALAYLWVVRLGRSGRTLARVLSITESAVSLAARRGEAESGYWDRILETTQTT